MDKKESDGISNYETKSTIRETNSTLSTAKNKNENQTLGNKSQTQNKPFSIIITQSNQLNIPIKKQTSMHTHKSINLNSLTSLGNLDEDNTQNKEKPHNDLFIGKFGITMGKLENEEINIENKDKASGTPTVATDTKETTEAKKGFSKTYMLINKLKSNSNDQSQGNTLNSINANGNVETQITTSLDTEIEQIEQSKVELANEDKKGDLNIEIKDLEDKRELIKEDCLRTEGDIGFHKRIEETFEILENEDSEEQKEKAIILNQDNSTNQENKLPDTSNFNNVKQSLDDIECHNIIETNKNLENDNITCIQPQLIEPIPIKENDAQISSEFDFHKQIEDNFIKLESEAKLETAIDLKFNLTNTNDLKILTPKEKEIASNLEFHKRLYNLFIELKNEDFNCNLIFEQIHCLFKNNLNTTNKHQNDKKSREQLLANANSSIDLLPEGKVASETEFTKLFAKQDSDVHEVSDLEKSVKSIEENEFENFNEANQAQVYFFNRLW